MKKAGFELNDLSIAPRRAESALPSRSTILTPVLEDDVRAEPKMLPKPTAQERRESAEARAAQQDDVRTSLKNLKRSKQRTVKFFINIALDYDLKARLQKASMENDLKMTQVVKAALEYYLSANDY